MGTVESAVEFRALPQPSFARAVREGTTKLARAHGVDEENLLQFLTALGEAVANAIEHSGTHDPIDVSVRVADGRLHAVVRDRGIGFAVEERREPALPDADAERGRGLPIMRRCCDQFAVTSARGAGTTVVLARSLRTRAVA